MSTAIATALINWTELWKIILAALVGGTGVVIVFGLLLLGISRGKAATRPTTRYGLYALSGLCGVLLVAVATVGVYAMTQKSSSAKPKQKAEAAPLVPASATQQRAARTRVS
jgi:NADH:ubiquinone oxidoreductase subunit 6 (subunit J)